MKRLGLWLWHLPRTVFIVLISLYQKSLSPDHGLMKGFFPYGFCRFEPSCSQYTKERLAEEGLVIGGLKGIWQILRCNPWNRGNRLPNTDIKK